MFEGFYRIHLWELLALTLYILIISFISYVITKKNIYKNPSYKYFTWGLMAKVFGSISLCFIYTFYYYGGDTTSYFDSGLAFSNMITNDLGKYLHIMMSDGTWENFLSFNNETGFPLPYIFFDPKTLFVSKIFSPIIFLSFNSFLFSSVMVGCIAYSGVWKLYQVFYDIFPQYMRECAIGILLIPSVAFWGSGMLKDTITLSASGWLVYGFYNGIVQRKKIWKNITIILLCCYVIVSIKPYILMAILPGALVWAFSEKIKKITNVVVRAMFIPLVYAMCIGIAIAIIFIWGDKLGKFSPDKILETAIVSQQDLKDERYQGNSFDIGEYEATPTGVLSKFPIATLAGLYMPFLWQVKNIVMLLSALENLYILILSIQVLVRPKSLKLIIIHPILLFSISYSIFFGFFVGFSTSNFGALVRFRIAYLPFFATGLLILKNWSKKTIPLKYAFAISKPNSSFPPTNTLVPNEGSKRI